MSAAKDDFGVEDTFVGGIISSLSIVGLVSERSIVVSRLVEDLLILILEADDFLLCTCFDGGEVFLKHLSALFDVHLFYHEFLELLVFQLDIALEFLEYVREDYSFASYHVHLFF